MTKFISFQEILLNQVQIPVRLLERYTSLGLNETEVMIMLQLVRFMQENNEFPTPGDLAAHLTISEKDCANILRKLIQQNFYPLSS